MTKNELLYITTIAELKNLSDAARELYVSQPSLSIIVAKIEAEFGQKLFLRTPSGVELTSFGQHYVQTAREILLRYEQLQQELSSIRTMQKGEICFGIPVNLGTMLLPKILPEFLRLYPNIKLNYKEYNSLDLDHMLIKGKVDFCIMHFQEKYKNINYEYLASDPFYLVVPADHPLACQYAEDHTHILSIPELQKCERDPFILVDNRQALGKTSEQILRKLNIHPNIPFITKSAETSKRMVSAKLGITFLPFSRINLFSESEGICYYPLPEELHAFWTMGLAYPSKSSLSNITKELIQIIKENL